MLVLKYHGTTTIPIEADCITPDNLAAKTTVEILELPLQHGNAQVPLREFFTVRGAASDLHIVIEGDCNRVKWLGTGMKDGTITIQGNAGMHLGAEMRGGTIHVTGNVGDWLGAEMRGGRIHIQGNAGNLVGAGYRGSRFGMRGGAILIHGNAGDEIGSSMRRGLIAVAGNTGDFAGASLISGSVFLFGPHGIRPGAGMKRGTIALFTESAHLLPTFRYDCLYRPAFMDTYLRQLVAWGFTKAGDFVRGNFRRYSGDLVSLGKGEVLHWQAS